jgi:hypothetical protein
MKVERVMKCETEKGNEIMTKKVEVIRADEVREEAVENENKEKKKTQK